MSKYYDYCLVSHENKLDRIIDEIIKITKF